MAKKKATKKTATKKKATQAVKKTTKKTAPKTTKKAIKKATKKTAKKATKKVTPKATKKVAKKATPKTTKKMATKAMKPAAPKKESAAVIQGQTLQKGDLAPGFTLPDQNGKQVSLADFKGKNVVVYFYPKAMTPGCTVQACSFRDSDSKLKEADIVVLGISADPVKKLKKFEEKERLNFTLLSDEKLETIKAYHSWGPKKFMGREFDGILRQSFLIDREGKIIHVMHKVDTNTHHDDVLNLFKNQG